MYSVAPDWRLSRCNCSANSWLIWNDSVCPLKVCTGGRGRSVGRCNKAGAPANWSFQYANWVSRISPVSHWRSQTAKSANWIGRSGKGEGCPAEKAEYRSLISCHKTPNDQPSDAMWCRTINKTCSVSDNRTTSARSIKSDDKSKGRWSSVWRIRCNSVSCSATG